MAHIIEENIVIKVSKLVKTDTGESLVSDDVITALESVVEELIGNSAIVEVTKA